MNWVCNGFMEGVLYKIDNDKKPDKCCKIQYCCDGKSKLMIKLDLEKGFTDVE